MLYYDVQITTNYGETVIFQVYAGSESEAISTAIFMAEDGQAGVPCDYVVDCFILPMDRCELFE